MGTICADVDDRKPSSVYDFCSNIGEFHLKRPFASYDESVLNIVSAGAKSYVVTDRGFYCINSCDGQYIVKSWYRMGHDPAARTRSHLEQYRDFYIWGNELIFENRKNGKLAGFRVCPAQFEEPEAAA